MSATLHTNLPPLPPNTACKWQVLDCEKDELLVRHWLEVMRRVNPCYAHAGMHHFESSVVHRPWLGGAAYYYWDAEGEVAVALMFHPQRAQHQIVATGFAGRISPEDAANKLLEQSAEYLRERGQTDAFAVIRKQPGNPEQKRLYDAAYRSPAAKISIERDYPHEQLWRIEFPRLRS